MRTWKDVATLVKPKNLKGRFVARRAADFPFMLEPGAHVALVPPRTDLPRNVTVDFVRDVDGETYELGFSEVADEVQAHGLTGCHCLIERSALDERLYEDAPATWVGWRVVDGSGSLIGDVAEMLDNPAHPLLVVSRGARKPAYIPVVDEFVCAVDVEGRVVHVSLPEGLLDL